MTIAKTVIARAWEDQEFKRALLANSKATIESELGLVLPDDVEIYVHEQTDNEIHLILPPRPSSI